jgi:hypothetical protein
MSRNSSSARTPKREKNVVSFVFSFFVPSPVSRFVLFPGYESQLILGAHAEKGKE